MPLHLRVIENRIKKTSSPRDVGKMNRAVDEPVKCLRRACLSDCLLTCLTDAIRCLSLLAGTIMKWLV